MTDPAFDKADQTILSSRGADRDDDTIDFGFRTIQRADKARMVRGVFDSVADRYDIMNDVMIKQFWLAVPELREARERATRRSGGQTHGRCNVFHQDDKHAYLTAQWMLS